MVQWVARALRRHESAEAARYERPAHRRAERDIAIMRLNQRFGFGDAGQPLLRSAGKAGRLHRGVGGGVAMHFARAADTAEIP